MQLDSLMTQDSLVRNMSTIAAERRIFSYEQQFAGVYGYLRRVIPDVANRYHACGIRDRDLPAFAALSAIMNFFCRSVAGAGAFAQATTQKRWCSSVLR
jgi:hypothetical protein